MKCYKCGVELTTGDTNDGLCTKCKNDTSLSGLQAWVCPVCGRGNSPYNATCPCVSDGRAYR